MRSYRFFLQVFLGVVVVCSVGLYYSIFMAQKTNDSEYRFTIASGDSAGSVAAQLESDEVIGSARLFRLYLKWTGRDTNLKTGDYVVVAPLTIARIADALSKPGTEERTITIIPGWTLRDIAAYLVKEEIAQSEEEVYALTGYPAQYGEIGLKGLSGYPYIASKPTNVSLEGYMMPDTFRIYNNATVEDVIRRLLSERTKQIPQAWYDEVKRQRRDMHDVFTLASILQKEVRGIENKKLAADLFWRRLETSWAMQSDATVHYIFGSPDSVFTSDTERDSKNPYNTYEYPGLPPGPISTPGIESLEAAIFPTKNDYWFFLTTLDTGDVIFSKTLDEHTANVYKYLR